MGWYGAPIARSSCVAYLLESFSPTSATPRPRVRQIPHRRTAPPSSGVVAVVEQEFGHVRTPLVPEACQWLALCGLLFTGMTNAIGTQGQEAGFCWTAANTTQNPNGC